MYIYIYVSNQAVKELRNAKKKKTLCRFIFDCPEPKPSLITIKTDT